MRNRFNKSMKLAVGVLLACIAFTGFLYLNNDIGICESRLESDIRSSQKIKEDWVVDGTASDTMVAFISYPRRLGAHTFSVYVNRPGLSFGYFFRGGGSLAGADTGIAEVTVNGCNEHAFISMNRQQVKRLEVDKGSSMQVIDIDSSKPFSIVLPVNAGSIAFYDVDGKRVECCEYAL